MPDVYAEDASSRAVSLPCPLPVRHPREPRELSDFRAAPADEQVPLAVRKRTPFVLGSPRCAASQAIAQLAMRLEQGVAPRLESAGFFNRMFGWLRR